MPPWPDAPGRFIWPMAIKKLATTAEPACARNERPNAGKNEGARPIQRLAKSTAGGTITKAAMLGFIDARVVASRSNKAATGTAETLVCSRPNSQGAGAVMPADDGGFPIDGR